MKLIENIFPSAILKCCRFHLGQSWWRKILSLGLRNDYSDRESDIGKWAEFELTMLMVICTDCIGSYKSE
jgi:hypothetical protein